ncbi:kelch-like protein 26 [Ptychodera flava]|uniref:kelch-like protein 26 n=1 Tax=Ptychodera flava TaxID=63121 RepID=UPI003969F88F
MSTSTVAMTSPSQQQLPLQNLGSIFEDRALADVTLVVSGVEFPAHRVILAACSDYFKVMFTSQMQEQHKERVELKGDQLTAESVEALLQFIYTATLQLTTENVFDILTAADHLQIIPAVEKCCQFIVRTCLGIHKVRIGDCLSVSTYADKYSHLEYLDDTLNNMLAKNFVKLMEQQETYEMLSVDRLVALLDSDAISSSSEMHILQSVLKWLRSDPDKRMQHAGQVLSKVRMGLVDKYKLAELLEAKDIQSIPECRELYYKAMVYHALPDRSSSPSEINRSRGSSMALLALNTVIMQYFDRNSMTWSTLPNFVNHSTGRQITGYNAPAVVGLGNFIYVAGGNIQGPTNALSRYDIGRNAWENLSPMKACRFAFSLCLFDEYMYAIGGYSDSGYLAHNNVERYCFKSGHWQFIAQLDLPRFNVAVAPYKGYLYAIGGQKDKFTALRDVQRFNPIKNKWERMNPTKYAHTLASAMVANGTLYVGGGRTNNLERNGDLINCQHVEMYDDSTDSWSPVPQHLIPPGNIPAVIVGDEICIILNGFCYRTGIKTTEDQVYAFDLDDWQHITKFIRGLSVTCVPINIERLVGSAESKNSDV